MNTQWVPYSQESRTYGSLSLKEVAFLVLVKLTCSNEKTENKTREWEISVVAKGEGAKKKIDRWVRQLNVVSNEE